MSNTKQRYSSTRPNARFDSLAFQPGSYSTAFHLARGITGRYIGVEGGCELAVIIDADTTLEKLRDTATWNNIVRARDELYKSQGTNFDEPAKLLKLRYATLHNKYKAGYGLIAREINYECIAHLCNVVIRGMDLLSSTSFYFMLGALKLANSEIEEWYNAGITAIKSGHAPFGLTTGPANTILVRDMLRQYQQHISKEVVVVPPSFTQGGERPLMDYLRPNLIATDKADSVIKASGFDVELNRYKREADKLIRRLAGVEEIG